MKTSHKKLNKESAPFKLKAVVVAFMMFCSIHAGADCRNRYEFLIQESDIATGNNIATSIGLTILNFVLPPSIFVRASVTVAKGFNTADGIKTYLSVTEVKKVLSILNQAVAGEGSDLTQIHKLLQAEVPEVTLESVAGDIVNFNSSYLYCDEQYTASLMDVLRSVGISEEAAKNNVNLFSEIQPTSTSAAKVPRARVGHP